MYILVRNRILVHMNQSLKFLAFIFPVTCSLPFPYVSVCACIIAKNPIVSPQVVNSVKGLWMTIFMFPFPKGKP